MESRTKAVYDIGAPGVRSAKEVKLIALAQLADYVDGKTVDKKTGRVIRFTGSKWAGRTKVLYLLAKKYGGRKAIELMQKYKKQMEKAKTRKEKVKLVLEYAKKIGVSTSTAKKILKKVNQKK